MGIWKGMLGCLIIVTGCAMPPEAFSDVAESAADVGPCEQTATLFGISAQELPLDLTTATELPVTQGFQGLIFVRVGMRTQLPLPAIVRVGLHIAIAGKLDQTFGPTNAATRVVKGGVETTEIAFFFNDPTLADLIGQHAHIRSWTTTPGCRLSAEADVVLVAGAWMGADAGLWGEVTP